MSNKYRQAVANAMMGKCIAYKKETKAVLNEMLDIVAVKHDKWIDKPYPNYPAHDIRYCSECGWNIHKSKLRNSDLNWNYCPNCGADMRGDNT